MNQPLTFLKRKEAELAEQLTRLRKAIAALEPASSSQEHTEPPKSKIDLLRSILRQHPEGVKVSEVPELIRSLGHASSSNSTVWLSPSQLRPEDRFFIREDGLIKPTQAFLAGHLEHADGAPDLSARPQSQPREIA
jgi:hypothetical protein